VSDVLLGVVLRLAVVGGWVYVKDREKIVWGRSGGELVPDPFKKKKGIVREGDGLGKQSKDERGGKRDKRRLTPCTLKMLCTGGEGAASQERILLTGRLSVARDRTAHEHSQEGELSVQARHLVEVKERSRGVRVTGRKSVHLA